MTTGDMQSIIEQCDKKKDGIEAYRLLSLHCDPTNFNTSNTLMESIMELGRRRVTSVDDLLATMREVRKRLSAYEDRVAPLPDARQTFIPSMLITLLDGEILQFVRMKHASGDFEKMVSAIEEFRLIKKSATGKGALRQMRDQDEPDETEANEQWVQDAAAELGTAPETLLAAIGKGGGKGQRPQFRPGLKPGAKVGDRGQQQQQRQQQQQQQQQREPWRSGIGHTRGNTPVLQLR